MQLKPRYDADPILNLGGDLPAICEPTVRQNRRLGDLLATLTDEQWAHSTRCDAWTVRDVIVHLTLVNQFWAMSVNAGLAGEPTKFLATFDPAASPLEMGATNVDSPATVLANFLAASANWCSLIEGLTADDWQAQAEAPPGHVAVGGVVHHALWDSWIHERDIMLPLGMTPVEEPDEVSMSLRYALALAPSLDLSLGTGRQGAVAFDVSEPEDTFTVSVTESSTVTSGCVGGVPVVEAASVPLLEGVSMRAPMPVQFGDDVAWMFNGLKLAFDQ